MKVFSLESFHKEYETVSTEILIGERQFRILLPKDVFNFIDPHEVLHDFPLWAKLWKASWILAGSLAAKPVEVNKHFLEIGAGLGLVSIVAASCGHRITMTEYNPDALQFARANAVLNQCPHLPIIKLDWNHLKLEGKFDYIVASEVVYKEKDFPLLLKVFNRYLKPDGEIILASEPRRTTEKFYKYLQTIFNVEAQKKILRSETEKTLITLFRLTYK